MKTDHGSLRGLFVGQFLGAFNDNAFKLLLALLLIRGLAVRDAAGFEAQAQAQTTLAFVVFTLPLMVCSWPAASLADRVGKRTILVWSKVAEIALMVLGTLSLALQPEGGALALAVLGGMGAQSAFFSPAKYGILPELLPPERLTRGNGQLETWTFLAIIAGTVAGGVLLDAFEKAPWIAGVVLCALSVAGWLSIRTLPPVAAAASRSDAGALAVAWRAARGDRALWLAVLGSTFFWGIASLVSQNALVYGKSVLALSDTQAGIPLGVSVVGIGLGAWLVGRLSRDRLEVGWIPLGMIGLALACTALGALAPGFGGTVALMVLLGVSSGCVVVPINTLIQMRSPAERRGAVIALANLLAFGGVLAGTLGCDAMARAGLDSRGIFVGAAILVVAGTLWAVWLLPAAGLRLFVVLLTQTLYRVRRVDPARVPRTGAALLVSNHVSFVDGLLIQAALDRPVRFLVDASYYSRPLLKPIMKLFGFVPIAQEAGPREMLKSIRAASEYLARGELVCLFAEGEITRTGQLLPFRRGFQRILKGHDVPIVPVHLDRLWGSVFSFAGGRPMRRLPARIPLPVTVSFGAPLPPTASPSEVRNAVAWLGADAWSLRREQCGPLHAEFVRRARRRPWRLCCADATRPQVSRLRTLAASVAIARALRATWRGQERVGVLLPPSVGAACVNLAASLAGRCAVNLNYTVGANAFESAIAQAGLRSIVTSRAFLERVEVAIPPGVEVVELEDLRARIGRAARCFGFFAAMLLPLRALERACGAVRETTCDDTAAVIFSSGSTGEPKGIVLSHFNIASNGDAAMQALPLGESDSVLGILPLFHSFGTLALWLALRHGLATVFHPSPLDAPAIGELVQRHRVTVLIATPTFLQLYVRRIPPGQFGSLRLCVSGAEKLPERVADAFEERFGLRPLEGYGTTECSPVVSVNAPPFRAPGLYQAGSRNGTVGRPMPGVAVRIACLDTGADLAPGEPGMLWVRGPNVMQGYLDREDLTAEVVCDGWYRTGDIACVDEDGYLRITDRQSRFSKIGGEMVPHGVIEAALHEAAGSVEQVFAVTALPCPRKGERIAVLHTLPSDAIAGVLDALASAGLPNLFVPRAENFVRVADLPMLGTGKLDLAAVRREAERALGSVEIG